MSEWQKVGGIVDMWNPETTKEVQGKYVNREDNIGRNNASKYVLETPDGKQIGVWGSTVINNRMSSVNIGDEVKISYLGKEKNPKSGFSFKNFDVFVRRAGNKGPVTTEEKDDIPF